MNIRMLRSVLPMLLAVLVASCGGGGGGGGAGFAGVSAVGTGGAAAGGGGSSAGTSAGGAGAADASPAGAASGAAAGAAGVAGGAAADGDASATAAAGGDDGSGVGSGGTGVSAKPGVGIGSVDGFGSVIVNGIRDRTDAAVFDVQDTSALQLGMSVKVDGSVQADLKNGTATRVESAADLRGTVDGIDLVGGRFTVLGTAVSTDSETVWADVGGLAGLRVGTTVQVWGLPAAPGALRATRIEQVANGAAPVLTGTVQSLDTAARRFSLGPLRIDYTAASLAGLGGTPLADGAIVRVRADAGPGGSALLRATAVQRWYPVPQAVGIRVDLAGVIGDFAGLGAFRLLGTPVDATGAQITGGQLTNLGNGVKVEVGGLLIDGVLRATKVKLRNVPGTGGPSSFALFGNVGAFASPASFRVRGQPVDASGAGVVFVNGSAGNLRNGVGVTVNGSRILNGVLLADSVRFD